MQSIVLLALVGAAAVATGMGVLSSESIMIGLQPLGLGEKTFHPPVMDPSVDASIEVFSGFDSEGNSLFKNPIISCSFHYSSDNDPNEELNGEGAKIICKLLNCPAVGLEASVIAEGFLEGPFEHSITYIIPIEKLAFENANFASEVCDMQLIFLGPSQTQP